MSAALGIEGMQNLLIFSVSSDGTDGPTDAAGGIADGGMVERLRKKVSRRNDFWQRTIPIELSNRLVDCSKRGLQAQMSTI